MTTVEPAAAGPGEVGSGDTRRSVLRKAILIGLGAGTLVVTNLATSAEPANAGTQGNWRWCRKCQGMFFPGNGTTGKCPAGGGHDQSISWQYYLNYEPTYDETSSYQRNWRWCGKCQGLFYAGNGTTGKCPAGGGHYQSVSVDYVLDTLPGGQGNWRWCGNCQGLFYAGNGTGKCPVGGGHYQSVSADYNIGFSTT
jgi:hypothetical protein